MKRIAVMILCLAVFTSVCPSYAAQSEEIYTDASSMTDEEFFGVWDSSLDKWTNQSGKLNYEAYPGLDGVLKYVKQGNYTDAKSELMYYFKNRGERLKSHNVSYDYEKAELLADGILWDNSVAVGGTFTAISEPAEYAVDVSSIIKRRGSYSFNIMQRYKSEAEACLYTRESEHAPTLEIYCGKERHTYTAVKDTYVDAGNMDSNFGTQEYMYCKESTDDDESNIYKNIYGPQTKRAVLQFNISDIDRDETIDTAIIKVWARSEGEATSLILYKNDSTIWNERQLCWSNSEQTIVSYNGTEYNFANIPNNELGFADGIMNNFARFQWATNMCGCYVTSQDEKYAEALIKLINSFIYSTRNDVGAYNSQDAAMRLNLFVNIFNDLLASESMNPDACTAFVKNCWQVAKFLTYPANYRGDHNHGCFHTRGLMKAVVYFPEFRTNEEWTDLVITRWNELASNLMANRDYREGTTGYAITVLNIFNNAILDTEYFGIELGESFREYTRKLGEYIANICYPDGINIQLGDSDATDGFSAVLQTAQMLEDKKLEYMCTNGESGEYPGYDSVYFAGSNKLAFMRTGWGRDDLMLAINAAGADGRSHTHLDNLSLGMYAYGKKLIVDTGRRNYNDDSISNWLRLSTESHNTVMIDGRNQGLASGDVPLFYTNKYFDSYQGYDATVSPYRHTRNILFVKPYFWIVNDYITGAQGDDVHTYDQNWHFLPEANISLDGGTMTTNFENGANLKIINVEREGVTGRIRQGYYSASSSNTNYANYLTYSQSCDGNAAFDTVLFPIAEGSDDDCSAQRIETDTDGVSAYRLSMKLGGREYSGIVYTSNEPQTQYRHIGAYGFDGRQMYVEKTPGGMLSTVNISNGSVLDFDGKSIVAFGGSGVIADLSLVYDSDSVALYSETVTAQQMNRLSVYADREINSVTLNGNPIAFYENSGYITFAGDSGSVEVTDGTAVLDDDVTTSAEVMIDNKKYSVSLTFGKGTTLRGENWDGRLPVPIAQSTSVKVDGTLTAALGYTNRGITFDNPVTLTLPQTGASVGYIRNGTLYKLESDRYVNVKNGKDKLEVGFSDELYDIVFYKEKTTQSSSYGGSGGSGGSGGVTSAPAVIPTPQPTAQEPLFGDIDGHWAKEYIEKTAKAGIAAGADGMFKPEQEVTRAEFMAFIARIDGMPPAEYDGGFSDVSAQDWFASAVAAAVKSGVAVGSGDLMRPQDCITREEACAMLCRAAVYLGKETNYSDKISEFSDREQVSGWAQNDMNAMLNLGIISGTPDNRLAPKENTTRAMAVTMIGRLLGM